MLKLKNIFFSLSTLVLLVLFCGCSNKNKLSEHEYLGYLLVANSYIKHGYLSDAKLVLEKASQSKLSSDWYATNALLLFYQGDFILSEKNYIISLNKNSANFSAMLNYASLLIKQEKYSKALEFLFKVVHSPSNLDKSHNLLPYANFNIGIVYLNKKDDSYFKYFIKAVSECNGCSYGKENMYKYLFNLVKNKKDTSLKTKFGILDLLCKTKKYDEYLGQYLWYYDSENLIRYLKSIRRNKCNFNSKVL
jgi:Tfp pilus assembly protein PilF